MSLRSHLFWISLVVLLGLSPVSPALTAEPVVQSVELSEFQELRAQIDAKLDELSPEEIAALDKKLADALQFYYEEQYARALPIFRDVATIIDTLDLMFWIGISAAKSGELELSIRKFRQMLAIQPTLSRVRLELADVLLQAGQFKEAKQELNTVKTSDPPPSVLEKIENRLALIAKKEIKTRWGFFASQGLQYDDNITSGPDADQIAISSGTLTLEDDEKPQGTYNLITKIRGNLRHDVGETGGWLLNAKLNLFNQYSLARSDTNYMSTTLSGSPWRVWPKGILKLPFSYTDARYGNVFLSSTVATSPSYEHFFSKQFSLRGSYTYAYEDYSENRFAGYDNTLNKIEFGPNFYLRNKRHIISLNIGYDDRNADLASASYFARTYGLSYFTKFPTKTELFAKYTYWIRKYDDNPPLFDENREDIRGTFNVVVSQRFRERFFVSLEYLNLNNASNAALYSFDKNMVTLNIGGFF